MALNDRPAGFGMYCTMAWTELRAALIVDGFDVPAKCGDATRVWIVSLAESALARPRKTEVSLLDSQVIAEAAEVLQMVLDSGVKLPPNWRGPLLDELSGIAGAIQDGLKA